MYSQFKRNNFYYLFFAQLFLLILIPLANDLYANYNSFFGQLAFSTTLILSVLGLVKSVKWLIIGSLLVLIGIICSYLYMITGNSTLIYIALVSDLLFLILATTIAIYQVISSEVINLHNIIGAICVYILLGIIWSLLFLLSYLLIPNSFSGLSGANQPIVIHDFLYFSFVTLTSLGYGDLLPLSATAKTLAFIEAILGQFYIATIVAGLVAVHITSQAKN